MNVSLPTLTTERNPWHDVRRESAGHNWAFLGIPFILTPARVLHSSLWRNQELQESCRHAPVDLSARQETPGGKKQIQRKASHWVSVLVETITTSVLKNTVPRDPSLASGHSTPLFNKLKQTRRPHH